MLKVVCLILRVIFLDYFFGVLFWTQFSCCCSKLDSYFHQTCAYVCLSRPASVCDQTFFQTKRYWSFVSQLHPSSPIPTKMTSNFVFRCSGSTYLPPSRETKFSTYKVHTRWFFGDKLPCKGYMKTHKDKGRVGMCTLSSPHRTTHVAANEVHPSCLRGSLVDLSQVSISLIGKILIGHAAEQPCPQMGMDLMKFVTNLSYLHTTRGETQAYYNQRGIRIVGIAEQICIDVIEIFANAVRFLLSQLGQL